ncbi:MAG: glutamyl-tRNA reductase [Myxococcota bacterium]
MSDLCVVGVSHHTAELAVRERLAVEGDALRELLGALRGGPLREGVVLSTCNRVEFYAHADAVAEAESHVRELLLARAPDVPVGDVLYTRSGRDAVRHAFRVASSLDSLVVGEPQILGQIKEAYDIAHRQGAVGTLLDRWFSRAFAVAKRVRSETSIAEGTVSVSSIATALAKKIFGELTARRVVLIGAGEMGEAAAKSLAGTGASLRVINRSPEKAKAVAKACGGEAREYEALASELAHADVVISTTASKRPILTETLMKGVTRARRFKPLFLIDIAVPRDVDPRVGKMSNVFLYDVDDLQQVAEENLAHRHKAAEAAERIVEVEVEEFETWRRSLELTPTIVGMRDRFSEIVHAELERTLGRMDVSDTDRKALERMERALVNKLLHQPLTALKRDRDPALISASRRLFELDGTDEEEAQPQPSATPVLKKG